MGTGDEAKEFAVHKDYATRSSKFVKAALDKDWKEATEKRITLPEANGEAFGGYLDCLYAGSVTLARGALDTKIQSRYYQLAQMYILGDYLQDLRFCNDVLDCWFTTCVVPLNEVPNAALIELVWSRTSEDCPLRSHALESWKGSLHDTRAGDYFELHPEIPRKFMADLLRLVGSCHGQAVHLNMVAYGKRDRCDFHRHEDDDDRCS